MPEETSGLEAKVDMLLRRQADQERMIRELKSDFDQSRGAVRLIKFCAVIATGLAGVWASVHFGVR